MVVSVSRCSIRTSWAAASSAHDSIAWATTLDGSNCSRRGGDESILARSRRAVTVSMFRSFMTRRRSNTTLSSGSSCWARATSSMARVVASGVRSSCEALAAKRRVAVKDRSRRSSISSKLSASSEISSRGPDNRIRCARSPSLARCTAELMSCNGRSIRPATAQPTAVPSTARTTSTTIEVTSRRLRSCSLDVTRSSDAGTTTAAGAVGSSVGTSEPPGATEAASVDAVVAAAKS
ncbi:hypothetical protein D3C74_308110 [compost metagenome]